jgi:hypothetical protein
LFVICSFKERAFKALFIFVGDVVGTPVADLPQRL